MVEIAFTTLNDTGFSHVTICVLEVEAVPRKDETVEIDDFIYTVEEVEWHFSTRVANAEGYRIGETDDIIVRLTKVGEA